MLTTAKSAIQLSAIALGIVIVNCSMLPTNAQTNTTDDFNFEEIGLEESNWTFESENETISVQDDIERLEEYGISDLNDSDVRLIEEDRRAGNKRGRSYYSIEADVYNY